MGLKTDPAERRLRQATNENNNVQWRHTVYEMMEMQNKTVTCKFKY